MTINISSDKVSEAVFHLPIPSHPPGEVITTPLCFYKDDGLVLFLTHDFLKQTEESLKKKKKYINV